MRNVQAESDALKDDLAFLRSGRCTKVQIEEWAGRVSKLEQADTDNGIIKRSFDLHGSLTEKYVPLCESLGSSICAAHLLKLIL